MDWYEYIAVFVMLYPAIMAVYWTVSGLLYFLFWENRSREVPEFGEDAPLVSILVPCYNEADNLDTCIPHLLGLTYPNYELVFVNDGSRDGTLDILRHWKRRHPDRITVIDQRNGGKASAMNNGAKYAKGKYLVGIDGDAVPDYHALEYIVDTLETRPEVGAVTGNPRVRNRSTILGKLQVAEFSSIIGLIKRSQSMSGTLFTVSGVIMCIRKSVWQHIGGWSENMITDDIDISWKTQTSGYDIVYEPRTLCWVLMPETLRGLYRQRLRWAQGGAEVILKYAKEIWKFRNARLWPLYFEYLITLAWTYAFLTFAVLNVALALSGRADFTLLEVGSLMTFAAFIIQLSVSLYIDNRYEKGLFRYFISCIWYPYAFWLLNGITLMHGFPKAVFRDRKRKATWISPDRGIR